MCCVLLFFTDFVRARPIVMQHKVKSGETLSSIARKYKISVSSILNANYIKKKNHIPAGLRLTIPTTKNHANLKSNAGFIHPIHPKKKLAKFKNTGNKHNYGIVWKTSNKSKLVSIQDGVVIKIGYLSYYGTYIMIDHRDGWISMYSDIDVDNLQVGDRIKQGQVLGVLKSNICFFSISHKGKIIDPDNIFYGTSRETHLQLN